MSVPGQDMGEGSSSMSTPSKGLSDEMLLNGGDIKLENPSTPQIMDPKTECGPDLPPLHDLGHPDFPDCKNPMYGGCFPPYSNNMPSNPMGMGPSSGGPPEFGPGPPPPHGPGVPMGNYPPPPPSSQQSQTKQQPSTLEAQYMQQQSQIFVFSTKLANKAADSVFQHQFPSIIAFHISQPATRKFLEKNPFKMNNFGRPMQGNSNWPPPSGSKKGNKGHMMPVQGPPQGPGNMPPDFNMPQGGPPPNWNTQNPNKPSPQGFPNFYDGPGPGQQFCGPPVSGPGSGPGNCPPPGQGGQPAYMCPGQPPGGSMPSGIKIPDENLTPQQRMHREEQLAKMNRMKALLFPENDHPNAPGDPNCHPPPQLPPPENMDNFNVPGQGDPSMGVSMGPDYMSGPGGPPSNKPPVSEWNSSGGFFMDGQPMGKSGGPLPPPGVGPQGNGPRSNKGGSVPSPATPLTPGSSCGAPLNSRPSPHSPASNEAFGGGGHSYYPSGYYSPQVGQVPDSSPSAAVQRKDSESSNSDGPKSRKEKSSCSISPTSSAPPSVKEPNLMPVPSPQQIQYMNVFEGQELTIQKQPNVGLSEHNNQSSPGAPNSNADLNPPTPVSQSHKPSHSAPPTPVSGPASNNQKSTPDMPLSSSSSKTRPGSVGPVVTPKSSTTPNPSPQAIDRISQPGTPLQTNLEAIKTSSSNSFPPNGNPPNGSSLSCGMMKSGMPPMGMEPHTEPPGGPGTTSVFDNVPLNPNLSGPGPPGNKPAFDPISSMVQMSQQLTGGSGSSPNPPCSTSMGGGSGGGYGMNPPSGPPMNPNMVNFNTSMHSVQNIDGNGGGMAMGGPQTVNNTYVNATMTIQQMNIQNIPPYMNPGSNMNHGPPMGHQMNNHMGQQMGPMGQPMNHMPPMGGGGPMGPMGGPGGQMGQGPPGGHGGPVGPMGCGGPHMGGPRGVGPPQMGYNQSPRMGPGPGMSAQGPGPGPGPNRNSPYRMPNTSNGPRAFGGTNIQVKPNAPNTIQYLPARPPPPHNQGPGMCSQPGVMGGPGPGPGPGPAGRTGPNLDFLQRYTNPGSGPSVNVNMGMNVNVNMGANRMQYPGPPPPSSMAGGSGPPPGCGPMRGPHPPPQHQMMDGMPGGPPVCSSSQSMPPGMPGGGVGSNGNNGMKSGPVGGGNGVGGFPPGGPQGPPPPQGPPTSDPAYAQQFHHFQQQLYATGTNNGRNSMQPNVQNNPNGPF